LKKLKKETIKKVNNNGLIIYSEYEMSLAEKITYFIIAFTIGSVVGYIFYFNIFVGIAIGVIAGVIYLPTKKKQIIDKRKVKLHLQFKDMLEALSTSIGSGKNIPDAFKSSYDDLKIQYTDEDFILIELTNILSGINNNINIEVLLVNFGERSGIDDILSFADVFDTCYRKGGNIKEVIKNTYDVINDKIEVAMEIDTVVTEKKTEHTVMTIMPVGLVTIMRVFGGGDTAKNFSSVMGIMANTIAIVIFVIAYFVGKKILDIKL